MGGAWLSCARKAPHCVGEFPTTWGTKANGVRALIPGWDDPKVSQVSPASCALGLPSSHPQMQAPSLAEGTRGRLRHGRADAASPGLGARKEPGICCTHGALAPGPAQLAKRFPARWALRPHPRGLAHPAVSLEEESGDHDPRATVRVLAGHRRVLDPAQRLCRYFRGAPRAKSALGVDLIL